MEAAATVELALDAACDLGEGPVWDARTGRLYFVDINRNAIHAYTPPAAGGESAAAGDAAAERHFTITLDEPVGCVALTSDPSLLLAATRRAVRVVRVGGGPRGAERALAEAPAAHGAGEALRFNDGKVSPQGAFILGRMHSDWRKGERGRLYSLDPGAAALRELLVESGGGGGGGGAHLPNGMDWSADGRTFFFADSGSETVDAYAVDAVGAPTAAPPRRVAALPSGHAHVPDGLCLDAAGNLWVALGESGAVVCYSPTTGEELRRVALPVKRPTSCAFGGGAREVLYVTTRVEAGEGASAHHGGLFAVRVPGVRGAAGGFHEYAL